MIYLVCVTKIRFYLAWSHHFLIWKFSSFMDKPADAEVIREEALGWFIDGDKR